MTGSMISLYWKMSLCPVHQTQQSSCGKQINLVGTLMPAQHVIGISLETGIPSDHTTSLANKSASALLSSVKQPCTCKLIAQNI